MVQNLYRLSTRDLPTGPSPKLASDPLCLEISLNPKPKGLRSDECPITPVSKFFRCSDMLPRQSNKRAKWWRCEDATDNAHQFIKDLPLEYNKMRRKVLQPAARNAERADWRSASNYEIAEYRSIGQVIGPVVDVEFGNVTEHTQNL